MKWISVKDKLPEIGKKVDTLDCLGTVKAVFNGKYFVSGTVTWFQITHWRHLDEAELK